MQIAPAGEMWWSPQDPNQPALSGSWIELGKHFYEAISVAPVPVDMRALRALKQSPQALDLYALLTYEAFRAHQNGKARFVSWEQINNQLGGEYADLHNLQKKIKATLVKIQVVYPALRLGKRRGGIEILPDSLPSLSPRSVIIGDKGKTP